MVTTIQISNKLKEKLATRKMSGKDSYEDVIWDLFEDTMELTEQTKREIAQSRKEVKAGKYVTHEQVKKRLRL